LTGAPRTPDTARHGDLAPMKILLVEDEAVTRLTLRAILSAQGHDVTEAENGSDAWGAQGRVQSRRVSRVLREALEAAAGLTSAVTCQRSVELHSARCDIAPTLTAEG